MLILLGYLVVLGTVFGGYLMTGGSLGALYQPAELVIIAGAGIGSFIVGNNGKAIKGTLKALPLLFRRSKYTKAMYMDLLALLYRLMAKSRQMGMFSLERDIENPRESEIFASYPRILASGAGRGLTSSVWYCCGCNGGSSRVRFSRSSCRRAGGAYRTCDGGDFPRHFIGLRIYFPISECFTSEKRRNQQNDAVRQSHTAI